MIQQTLETASSEVSTTRRNGSVWDYLSPSRLNLWMRCPLAFKLRYIEGVRTPTSTSMFLGKCVHAGLEILYRHRMLGVTLARDDVVRRATEIWDESVAEEEITFKSTDDEAALRNQMGSLLTTYLDQLPADEPRPRGVEVTMEMPLVDPQNNEDLGMPLLGVVDLIQATEGGDQIIDFKTSSRSGPPFEVTHEVQLSCYAYLYRQMTGKDESGLEIRSLVRTKKPKIDCHSYPARSPQHFDRLFRIIREYLDALHAGRFNYRPGWACGMCDHRETHCKQWCG